MSLSILKLPINALGHILSFLSSTDRRQASRVSKAFQAAYERLFTDLIGRSCSQPNSLFGKIATQVKTISPHSPPSSIVRQTSEKLKIFTKLNHGKTPRDLGDLKNAIETMNFDIIDGKFLRLESQLQSEIRATVKNWKEIFDGQPYPTCCSDVIRTVLASDRLASLPFVKRDELFSTIVLIAMIDPGSIEHRNSIFNSTKFDKINPDILGTCLLEIARVGDLDLLHNLIKSDHYSRISDDCVAMAIKISAKEGNLACCQAIERSRTVLV